jgi:hypothetical protein
MFFIYADPAQPDTPDLRARYDSFTQDVAGRGALRGGHELHRSGTATTVRLRRGETLSTDGPYAETKEQIGGFYILECADLDEAIELASKIPNAEDGCIEVRPIMERQGAD